MTTESTWLPQCLRHINEPYLKDSDDAVVIGELSSADRNGNVGTSFLHTALVPMDRLEEVLAAQGGIGWNVKSWGPGPIVDEGETYKSDFWVEGPAGMDDRLEPLVVGWEYHNKTVMMPDNGFLMCYGLCPRVQKDPDRIIWDDLSRPQYGVVSVKPLSHYEISTSHTGTEVKVDRQYLEDYASLKGCAVVAVLYEERRCSSASELEAILEGQEAESFEFPGRELIISRNEHHAEAPILCRIWGCRLVLVPSGRPISVEQDPELEWPGFSGVMTQDRAMEAGLIDYAYVSDQLLEQFEGRPEYEVNPIFGSVSYDGWWSLSHCHRVARDYVAYELKKIYEGCPPAIIQQAHRFAVDKAIVERQLQDLGDQNIGKRAGSLVEAFLSVGASVAALGDRFGFAFQDEDIVSLSKQQVDYYGWWTINALTPLGYRAALDMTKAQFLERCVTVYRLIEGVKERPLRRVLSQIGLDKGQLGEFRSFKLLATLLQICELSVETGLDIAEQRAELVARWDQTVRLDDLRSLFALVDLRNAAGHNLGTLEAEKVTAALEAYGIQEDSMSAGWGLAVDEVYDHLIGSLNNIATRLTLCGARS